jgi:hypothetical protein
MWLDLVLVLLNIGMSVFCIYIDNAIIAAIAAFAAGVYYGEFKQQLQNHIGE